MPERDARQEFTDALPRIEGLASAYLGPFKRDKEDMIAEVVAIAWAEYRKLAERGRDVTKLLGKIVQFAAMRVRSGRGLTNVNPEADVLSARCRFRHAYFLNALPSEGEAAAPEVLDALRSEPADQALRLDVEAWLGTLDGRHLAVAEQLASGLNSADVARLQGVSRMRVYQLRCDLMEEWREFNNGID